MPAAYAEDLAAIQFLEQADGAALDVRSYGWAFIVFAVLMLTAIAGAVCLRFSLRKKGEK